MAVKCPSKERVWWLYRNTKGENLFLMTSKKNSRDYYYLYKVLPDDSLEKLGRAKIPTELEDRFAVIEKMSQ